MPRRHALSIAIAISLVALPAHADGMNPQSERLLVGRTNIFCVQAPCPWRGIVRQDELRPGPAAMLWSEADLPRLDASAEDASRIEAAWDSTECLAIDGSLTRDTLRVDRIVGACL